MQDGVALASVISSALLGMAGLAYGATAARKDRDAARQLAADERLWHERVEAYIALLAQAERFGHFVDQVEPVVGYGQDPPPVPSVEEQHVVRARVTAVASSRVRELDDEWGQAVNAVFTVVRRMAIGRASMAEHGTSTVRVYEEMAKLEGENGLRAREKAAREALQAAIADELAMPALPR